jgi:hypothetical protein
VGKAREVLIRTKGGEQRTCVLRVNELTEGAFIGIMQDITDSKVMNTVVTVVSTSGSSIAAQEGAPSCLLLNDQPAQLSQLECESEPFSRLSPRDRRPRLRCPTPSSTMPPAP